MQDYEAMLERAYEKLPKSVFIKERFEIPKVKGLIHGNKTIITNFKQIIDALRRPPEHLLKYLLKELASPGNLDGHRLILGRKISSAMISSKIESYANEFVLCPDCKKPDTTLKKEERVTTMKCMACGAKHPISYKI